jgi:hypothetical protein
MLRNTPINRAVRSAALRKPSASAPVGRSLVPPNTVSGGPVGMAPAQTPDDVMKAYLDQIRGLLTTPRPQVKPFDESGFYNENDVRALADQEYDPYYARLRSDRQFEQDMTEKQRQIQEAGSDRNRLEEVNAAGGYGSSAYQRELADQSTLRSGQAQMRQLAIRRALEEQDNEQRADKEQFRLGRRNEAYQRYLQSVGALQM